MDTDDAQRAHNDLIAQHRAQPADDRSPERRALDDADSAVAAAERALSDARVDRGRANAAYDDAVTAARAAYDAWADARDALSPADLDAWRKSFPAPTIA